MLKFWPGGLQLNVLQVALLLHAGLCGTPPASGHATVTSADLRETSRATPTPGHAHTHARIFTPTQLHVDIENITTLYQTAFVAICYLFI